MLIVSTRIVICAALASALGWISPAPTVQPISKAARPGETTASPAATKQPPARTTTASPFNANELVPLRAELDKQLNDLSQINEKDLTPTQKTLREVWKERVQLLDEWEKATRGRLAVENPKSSPERETADRRADLDRAQSKLELLKKTPESVLPDSFKAISEKVDDANLLEMREAIEAAKLVLNEKTIECEKLRAEPAARTASLADFRAARDKLHTQIIELPTRRVQYESAIVKAANEDARKIAREHYVNLKCESGLAAERLAMTEGYIALEGRRAATCTLANQAAQANLALAIATVELLTERYKRVAERQKADLTRAAKKEEKRAQTADDPLEKFKALRTADLLSLQALILEDDKALSTSPTLSLEEQKGLADRAEADFASLKLVVKENKVGGIVALRLNNDFRRISRERAIILRNDFTQSSAANTFYENALTEAELSYFNDARDDRFERDAFIQTLPEARHAAANAMIDDIEKKHKDLLTKRKDVLGKLLVRAEETHNQVTRHLRILDEHYTFIRTNIFWVRDSEPLGPATAVQVRRETGRLLASMGRLAADPFDRSQWTQVSVEFGIGVVGMLAFPWIIIQARKSLKAMSV